MPGAAPDAQGGDAPASSEREPIRARAWNFGALVTGGGLAAVAITTVLVLAAGSAAYTVLGFPDPGVVTKLGTNFLRLAFDVLGACCVGAMVFAAFFTRPQPSGLVSADGYAALRFGGGCAWAWACVSLLMTVFGTANTVGMPVTAMTPDAMWGLFQALDAPKAWLLSALLAAVVALACHFTLHWRATIALAAVALFAVVPPAFVGHSASNAGHDFATDLMVLHVAAAALWLGTLIALVLHVRRRGAYAEHVVARYRRLSLVCLVVLAVSGVLDSLILLRPFADPARLPNTGYGTLVLLKVGCLLVLAASAVLVRRRSPSASGNRGLLRLAGFDTAIMLVTLGVSMGMAHTPPPNLLNRDASVTEVVLGYNLPAAPSLAELASTWRFDLLLGTAALLFAVLYLLGIRRLRGRGESWPLLRTLAWLGGCAMVLVATSSGIGAYAPASLSVHMVSHLLLSMLGPVLLVLGMPITLALQALRPARAGELYGPREWLAAVVGSRTLRLVTHPAVASLLFVGSLYALYLTGLFAVLVPEHWAHAVVNTYFLVTGYLWFWTVLGVDHVPRRLPHLARLGITIGVMPLMAFFGVIMLSLQSAIAWSYYGTLNLPWLTDLMAIQEAAALIGWLGGEVPLLVVLIVLLVQWSREGSDGSDGSATDANADAADPDYAAMLAKLAESRR